MDELLDICGEDVHKRTGKNDPVSLQFLEVLFDHENLSKELQKKLKKPLCVTLVTQQTLKAIGKYTNDSVSL